MGKQILNKDVPAVVRAGAANNLYETRKDDSEDDTASTYELGGHSKAIVSGKLFTEPLDHCEPESVATASTLLTEVLDEALAQTLFLAGFETLEQLPRDEGLLTKIDGIGPAKAQIIMSAFEQGDE
jgi:hypothetical protein